MKSERRSCFREFARYTIFNISGMMGLSCYILADTYFVSKGLGASGLASLNLAIPIYSFIHGCGLMLGMGGATKYSIFKSQGAVKQGNRIFANTLVAAAVFALLFFLAGTGFSNKITLFLGADSMVFAMTNTYLKVLLLFAPVFILNDVLVCFIRNDGNPRLSMLAMLAGSFSNILLDYVFLFPLHMGILGAALATGISPVISMLILSQHRKKKERFQISWEILKKPEFHTNGMIISLGIPSLIAEVASGVVMIVFNVIILQICGNTGVAAYGVIANLSLVVISICTGIGQGMQPLVSRAYGSNGQGEIRFLLRCAVSTMLFMAVAIYTGIFVFADPVTGLFNSGKNKQLQEIAVWGLRIYFLAIPFSGFNIILSLFFTSTERALPAQVLSLLRGLVVIVPMAFFLSRVAGITGVWMAFPVTEGIVAAAGLFLYRHLSRPKI